MKIQIYEKFILKAYTKIYLPKNIIDSEIYFYYAGFVEKLLSNLKYKLDSDTLFDKDYQEIFSTQINELNKEEKNDVLEFYYLLKIVFNILKKYSEWILILTTHILPAVKKVLYKALEMDLLMALCGVAFLLAERKYYLVLLNFLTLTVEEYWLDIFYRTDNVGGGTVLNLKNAAESSRFRIDLDPKHLLHLHFGLTSKTRKLHRGITPLIAILFSFFN